MNYAPQGNWGAGLAESYYSATGNSILSPKNDSAESFDFTAYSATSNIRVSCKTGFSVVNKNGYDNYVVSLMGAKKRAKVSGFDELFVVVPNGMYVIPVKDLVSKDNPKEVNRAVQIPVVLRKNSRWHKYRVGDTPFVKEMRQTNRKLARRR